MRIFRPRTGSGPTATGSVLNGARGERPLWAISPYAQARFRGSVRCQGSSDGFSLNANVPALGHLSTYGNTREEALAQTREAVLGYLEAVEKSDVPVPDEPHQLDIVEAETFYTYEVFESSEALIDYETAVTEAGLRPVFQEISEVDRYFTFDPIDHMDFNRCWPGSVRSRSKRSLRRRNH